MPSSCVCVCVLFCQLEQALNEALDKVNQQNKIRAEQCTEVGTDITFRALLLVVAVVVWLLLLLLLCSQKSSMITRVE